MNKYYKGVIFVFLSVIGFALLPIFAVYAYRDNISVNTLLFLRFSLSALFFFGYLIIKKQKIKVTARQLGALFLLGGVFYTLQSTCFVLAVKYIPVAMVSLLLYTYPVFVAILSFFIEKEKLTLRILTAIVISFAGLVVFLGSSLRGVNLFGVILAAAAGLIYSFYIVVGNRVVQKLPSMVTAAYVDLFAAISFLLFGSFTHGISFAFPARTWLPTLGIVAFSTVLAMFTFFRGLEYIGSTRASVLSMGEPVISIVLSAILFGQMLNWYQFIGGAGVLAGAILTVLSRKPAKKISQTEKQITGI